jgi:hypothetical protein
VFHDCSVWVRAAVPATPRPAMAALRE